MQQESWTGWSRFHMQNRPGPARTCPMCSAILDQLGTGSSMQGAVLDLGRDDVASQARSGPQAISSSRLG